MRMLAGLLLAASMYGAVDKDMQRAIAWERHKERAAARQARLEKRNPSVTYGNTSADRSSDNNASEANRVKDPGPTNPSPDKAEKKK